MCCVPNQRSRTEQTVPYRTNGPVQNKLSRTEPTVPYRTWGRERGIPWETETCAVAALNGHLGILRRSKKKMK